MQSLECLDRRKSTPVDSVDVPHSNWAHDTTDAVPKETDGDSTQDNGGSTQWQVVEKILSGENHDTGGSIRGRCGRDGTNGVLFESPWPGVDKVDSRDPLGPVALATLRPPSSLKLVSAREEGGPGLAEEVGDKDDESA